MNKNKKFSVTYNSISLKVDFVFKTQRFLQEVTSDYVALTGLKMFSITRNFLLGVSNKIK